MLLKEEDVPVGSSKVLQLRQHPRKKRGKVHLNRATESELQAVSGIGQKRAQDIIAYRGPNGPFRSVDDVKMFQESGENTGEAKRCFHGGLKSSFFACPSHLFFAPMVVLGIYQPSWLSISGLSGDMFGGSITMKEDRSSLLRLVLLSSLFCGASVFFQLARIIKPVESRSPAPFTSDPRYHQG